MVEALQESWTGVNTYETHFRWEATHGITDTPNGDTNTLGLGKTGFGDSTVVGGSSSSNVQFGDGDIEATGINV